MMIRVKEIRRLEIPILDAEKRRPRIIKMTPKPIRIPRPSREVRRLTQLLNRLL
jgi:hypothetical protein